MYSYMQSQNLTSSTFSKPNQIYSEKNNFIRLQVKNDTKTKEEDCCPSGKEWIPGKYIPPSFCLNKPAPTRSNSLPSSVRLGKWMITGEVALDCPMEVWHYQLKSVESAGTMKIVYYQPDHYPAPAPTDDNGSLTNVNKTNWKTIVKDLEDNKEGIPDFWSAYRREELHEDYHWMTEWQGEVNKILPKAESDIDNLKVNFDEAGTETQAEKTLSPIAEEVFDKAMKQAKTNYNKLGDSPGDPSYKAQAPAIEALSKRVSDYAVTNKWDVMPFIKGK